MTPPLAIGARLGKLVYLGPSPRTRFERDRKRRGLWRCDCGKTKRIPMPSVVSGASRSCGCEVQKAMRGWLSAHRAELEAGARAKR